MAPLIEIPTGWSGFLWLWLLSYAGLLAIYFVLGLMLTWLARRHPQRRIQSRIRSRRTAAEIRQSLLALLTIAAYLAGGLSLQSNGWSLFAPAATPAGWLFGALLSLIAYDTWFYWGHRAMHTPALFRYHALHHRSLTPSSWANNSDSLVGAAVEQGYFLVAPLLLPIPPEILILHKLYDQASGMFSHCGHEFLPGRATRRPWPLLSTTFHDLHHSNFRCNYGNTFSLWDRVMGTLHSSYDARMRQWEGPGGPDQPAGVVSHQNGPRGGDA